MQEKENMFIQWLSLKYEYLYLTTPDAVWRWVYRNLIVGKIPDNLR